jgi:hypothetical protein
VAHPTPRHRMVAAAAARMVAAAARMVAAAEEASR